MDLLDLLDIGGRVTRGRVKFAFGLVALYLLVGWSRGWPIAHPLVQGAIDGRREQITEMVLPDR